MTVKTQDVCTLEEEWLEKLFNSDSACKPTDAALPTTTIQYEHPSQRKVEGPPSPNETIQSLKFTGFLKGEPLDVVPNYYHKNDSSIRKYSLAKRLPGSPEPLQFYLDPKLEDRHEARGDVHFHRQGHASHCAKQSLPFWPEFVSAIANITKNYETGSILARALQKAYGPATIGASIEALSQFLSEQNGFVCLDAPEQIQKGDFILGYDRQDNPKQAAICFEFDTVLHDANGKPERKDVHLFAANPEFANVKVFRFAG